MGLLPDMGPSPDIGIEVAYAEPHRAIVAAYRLPTPASVADALRAASADPVFEGIDVGHATVGVFGKVVAPRQGLADGDRVEIYRALPADPKSARRERVRQQRSAARSRR